jgi:transposase
VRGGLFWLNDKQWARIEPHLPAGTDRIGTAFGASSAASFTCCNRVRGGDCPSEYGPYTTIYNRFNRWAKRGRWCAISEALAVPGKDAVEGEHNQAIGRARARQKSMLNDPFCRTVVLHLTPGQNADIAAAPDVLALAPPIARSSATKV